jgi:hypothetical protein
MHVQIVHLSSSVISTHLRRKVSPVVFRSSVKNKMVDLVHLYFFLQAGQKLSANVAKTKAEREKERERKIGHRRVGVGGEITYKKIQTSQIMGSIQLGKVTWMTHLVDACRLHKPCVTVE